MESKVWFDGGIQGGNPGGVPTYGIVLEMGEHRHEIYNIVLEPPKLTNNVAEWYAVSHALQVLCIFSWPLGHITVYGDSQLVIKQLTGEYTIRDKDLRVYYDRAQDALDVLGRQNVSFKWVKRELNKEADELATRAYLEYLKKLQEL